MHQLELDKGAWSADAGDIEAVLSLWLYALDERDEEKKVQILGLKKLPVSRETTRGG